MTVSEVSDFSSQVLSRLSNSLSLIGGDELKTVLSKLSEFVVVVDSCSTDDNP